MLFSPSVILEKVEKDFVTSNESFSGFPRSGNLWDECLRTVQDSTLMNHIIFNNDVMEIPPLRTFLKASRYLDGGFTSYQKKAVAAFWEFVFREVFFYADQEDNAGVNVMGIRRGARFTNPPSEIMVGEVDEATGKILIPTPRRRLRMKLAKPIKTDISQGPILHDVKEPDMENLRSENPRLDDGRLSNERLEARQAGDRIPDESRVGDRRTDESRVGNPRIEDSRIGDHRIEDSRVGDQRIDDSRTGDRRIDDSGVGDQRLADERTENPRLEDERFENERLRGQRLETQRLEDELLEKQRLEDQRLENQGTEDHSVGDQDPEARRVEDERLEVPRKDDSSY